jgi:hypothetical protein
MGIAEVECWRFGDNWLEKWTQSHRPCDRACIVANIRELIEITHRPSDLRRVKIFLIEGPHALFLYGFSGLIEEDKFLKELTGDSIVSCRLISGFCRFYSVQYNCRLTSLRFEGLNFDVEESTNVVAFGLGKISPGMDVIMTVNQEPFLIRMTQGKSSIFLAGCHQIEDIDGFVPREVSQLSFFPSVVPFIIFLREVFGQQCWHNPSPRACLIIDDLLLRMKYGFIDYKALLEAMQKQQISISIAFIPWNYRRTSKDVANIFLSNADRFSLSIHGSDHTKSEFGGTDEMELRYKGIEALQRMSLHQRHYGVPFDAVMVFPQGLFSNIAMNALKLSGYLAVVNSTPYSLDVTDESLTLADLLDVAVTKYSNLPLFIRRYPKYLPEVAFDLFLGKPALLVEHHGYFRAGYDSIAALVDKLNSFCQRLKWTNLESICSRACMIRFAESGDAHLRFYTDNFWMQNNADQPQNFVLFRRLSPKEPFAGVRINGQRGDCYQENEFLIIPLHLNAKQEAEIRVDRGKFDARAVSFRQGPMRDVRVFIRRHLSECRDNYVDRNLFLSRIWANAQNLFSRR